MGKKKIDVWDNLSAEDLIEKMFERTDADGVLYMPSFFTTNGDDKESLRCVMRWEQQKDCFHALQEFENLRTALDRLAPYLNPDTGELTDRVGTDAQLLETWNTYAKPFDTSGFDTERIRNIESRLDTVNYVRELCNEIGAGNELREDTVSALRENLSVSVSDEERAYYDRYCEAQIAEAKSRLEDRPFAFRTVMHSIRYCVLASWSAPGVILEREAKALAFALTLFHCSKNYEYVNHAIRCHYDRLELMSEEELDQLSHPKNANSRKSLVPLFVYLILRRYSDSEHPLKQQDLIARLAEEPYEVLIERKALGRVIQNLKDSQLGIYTDRHRGTWYMGKET